MNLDELRAALAPLLPGHAAFDGWSNEALGMAARSGWACRPNGRGSPSPAVRRR